MQIVQIPRKLSSAHLFFSFFFLQKKTAHSEELKELLLPKHSTGLEELLLSLLYQINHNTGMVGDI